MPGVVKEVKTPESEAGASVTSDPYPHSSKFEPLADSNQQ